MPAVQPINSRRDRPCIVSSSPSESPPCATAVGLAHDDRPRSRIGGCALAAGTAAAETHCTEPIPACPPPSVRCDAGTFRRCPQGRLAHSTGKGRRSRQAGPSALTGKTFRSGPSGHPGSRCLIDPQSLITRPLVSRCLRHQLPIRPPRGNEIYARRDTFARSRTQCRHNRSCVALPIVFGVVVPVQNASVSSPASRTGRARNGLADDRPRPDSVRTGSGSGRPVPSPGPRSPSAARCGTRSTAVVLATVR